MDLGLKGKTALVGASSRGLGRAVADELAMEGANLVIADVDGDGLVNLTDVLDLLNYLFLQSASPALGARCVRILDCPSVCSL